MCGGRATALGQQLPAPGVAQTSARKASAVCGDSSWCTGAGGHNQPPDTACPARGSIWSGGTARCLSLGFAVPRGSSAPKPHLPGEKRGWFCGQQHPALHGRAPSPAAEHRQATGSTGFVLAARAFCSVFTRLGFLATACRPSRLSTDTFSLSVFLRWLRAVRVLPFLKSFQIDHPLVEDVLKHASNTLLTAPGKKQHKNCFHFECFGHRAACFTVYVCKCHIATRRKAHLFKRRVRSHRGWPASRGLMQAQLLKLCKYTSQQPLSA